MKKITYFSLAFFAISILSCQDGKEEAKDLSYLTNIGKQIPTETGYRWMDLYRAKSSLAGREKPSGYALSKENLSELNASVNDLIGVAFHHALDDAGNHHFLIIPVDQSLKIWSDDKKIVDSNDDSIIGEDVARQWAANYRAANPDAIWFHFFGSHVFDEVQAVEFFEYLQIEPAISDVNLKPQLLLIVNDLSAQSQSGRGKLADALVYDASSIGTALSSPLDEIF